MKKLTTIIITLFIVSLQSFAQDSFHSEEKILEPITSDITVEINGLSSDEGNLMVAIYSSEGKWLSSSEMRISTNIIDGSSKVIFEDMPLGTYGISTFHDENSDLKLDTGLFGIPTEPYASSRGAKGRFGPPQWNDAKFEVTNESHNEKIKF